MKELSWSEFIFSWVKLQLILSGIQTEKRTESRKSLINISEMWTHMLKSTKKKKSRLNQV